MVKRKRHWLWNVVIGLTVLVCLSAFILHSKNWVKEEEKGFSLYTGFYSSRVFYGDMESVTMVPRIPEMERESGFSVWGIEKGIFRDTLEGLEGIRVYVDELKYPKIRLQQKGMSPIYFNFRDSVETELFYQKLSQQMSDVLNQ
jgi:hypothetical protein